MTKSLKLVWLYSALVASITVSPTVSATEVPNSTAPTDGMETVPSLAELSNSQSANSQVTSDPQVTSVSQLSDVRPTDWAFQALQSLVERYGCIAGYSDKTYRGNRALTRYEFAAGLNACLDRINQLIASAAADLVKKEDLLKLQKLQEQFAAELATLRGRVDTLEARTATLEKQQFSTTTKLNGEVVIAAEGVLSGRTIRKQVNGVPVNERISRNIVLGDSIQLDLDTSFTGRDVLRTRFQAVTLPTLPRTESGDIATREGSLQAVPVVGTRGAGIGNNSLILDTLLYQFPLGDQTTVTLAGNAVTAFDFVNTVSPLDGNGTGGAPSQFGTRNPIYGLINGSGLGVQYQFNKAVNVVVGYLANVPAISGIATQETPTVQGGLFSGPYSAIAQLTLRPISDLEIGLVYIHAYDSDFTVNDFVGTDRANFRNLAQAGILAADVPTSANAYGAEVAFRVTPQFVVNGSVGYTNARSLARGNPGSLDIWNWLVGLSVLDVGKKGNQLGFVVGQEPHVVGTTGNFGRAVGTDDPSLHIEGFLQYQITDNISITPDIVWLTAPNGSRNSDSVVIGTIRTTFNF